MPSYVLDLFYRMLSIVIIAAGISGTINILWIGLFSGSRVLTKVRKERKDLEEEKLKIVQDKETITRFIAEDKELLNNIRHLRDDEKRQYEKQQQLHAKEWSEFQKFMSLNQKKRGRPKKEDGSDSGDSEEQTG